MSETPSLITPTIHLNGSGFDNLNRDYLEALHAVEDALQKLPVPHGRDYYVQGDDAYLKARAQFEAQADKLMEVKKDLMTILRDVCRQQRELNRPTRVSITREPCYQQTKEESDAELARISRHLEGMVAGKV